MVHEYALLSVYDMTSGESKRCDMRFTGRHPAHDNIGSQQEDIMMDRQHDRQKNRPPASTERS